MILQVVANVLLSSPPDRIFLGCKQKKNMVPELRKNRLQSGWIFVGFFVVQRFLGMKIFNKWGAPQATLMIVFYKIYKERSIFWIFLLGGLGGLCP